MATVRVRRCTHCALWMVPAWAYARWPRLRDRYASHKGRGLCANCYQQADRADELIDHERLQHTRDEVLDEWVLLRDRDGCTVPQAATRLGMTPDGLFKALIRARTDGDPRAQFTFHGAHALRHKGPDVTRKPNDQSAATGLADPRH